MANARPRKSAPIKRLFDLVAAVGGLVVLSPVLLATAIMVRLRLGSPILFRQVRPGLNGQPFEMIKFRTMLDATDHAGSPLPDADRLTPFGRLLRATSLDELPELWNVVKGEMSLVGPRPLLMRYLPHYSEIQARRHEVRPGITGLAQVSGRNSLSWDEKFALDVEYVNQRNMMMDFRIISKTVWKVLRREGVSADGHETMPEFSAQDADGP